MGCRFVSQVIFNFTLRIIKPYCENPTFCNILNYYRLFLKKPGPNRLYHKNWRKIPYGKLSFPQKIQKGNHVGASRQSGLSSLLCLQANLKFWGNTKLCISAQQKHNPSKNLITQNYGIPMHRQNKSWQTLQTDDQKCLRKIYQHLSD